MLCEYGCNRLANFILKSGRHCCEAAYQRCPALIQRCCKSEKRKPEVLSHNNAILCDFGCNTLATHRLVNGKYCCESVPQKCSVIATNTGITARKTKSFIEPYTGNRVCDYGCDRSAHYQFINGSVCCSKNISSCLGTREKVIDTCIEHFGCSNPMQVNSIRIEQNQKRDATMLERYGCINPIHIVGMKEKLEVIFLERYGVPGPVFLMKSNGKEQNLWLNYINVPDSKEHREVLIDLKDGIKSGRVVVDGFDPENKIVYEFLGDYWHGNLERFDENMINRANKSTMKELNDYTIFRRNRLINAGFSLIEIWESDWTNLKKNNPLTLRKI